MAVPLLGVCLAACSLFAPKFERPDISVISVQLTGGNFMQQTFIVKLHIENPNARIIPVTSLHAQVRISGDQVASGVNERPFVVPAHGGADFDMAMTANLALALLKYATRRDASADTIDYEMTGSASIDLPFLRDLPFRREGSLPLRKSQ